MLIPIAYLESSREIESNKYDIIDMRAYYILRHLTHGDVPLVILDVCDNFLKFRSLTLFLAVSINSGGGWLQR
jgi:hypothetical protein